MEGLERESLTRNLLGSGACQDGVALVLVLWVLVLLSTIAMAMATTTRMESVVTGNFRGEREARALIDAGIRFQVLQIIASPAPDDPETRWPADGVAREWRFAGHAIRVRAVPESARIDVNAAAPEFIAALFEAAGVDGEQARALADRIADWRDADSEPREYGAEDDDYREAGLPYGAKDSPFETVSEIQQVMGVSRTLFKAVEPALTVHSRRRTVNPMFASPLVLDALPGMDAAEVEAYAAAREEAGEQDGFPLPEGAEQGYLSFASGAIYRVSAEVDLPDGVTMAGELVVARSSRNGKGYRVLAVDHNPPATRQSQVE